MAEAAVAEEIDEKSETLRTLEEEYKANPNAVLRKVNHVYARKLLNKPKMTWAEFCEMKKKAYAEHWEAKKLDPDHGKVYKVDPDNIEKEEKRLAKMQAAIAAAKAKKAAETAKKK